MGSSTVGGIAQYRANPSRPRGKNLLEWEGWQRGSGGGIGGGGDNTPLPESEPRSINGRNSYLTGRGSKETRKSPS